MRFQRQYDILVSCGSGWGFKGNMIYAGNKESNFQEQSSTTMGNPVGIGASTQMVMEEC